MSETETLSLDEALALVAQAFEACGAAPAVARAVAAALVSAEADGQYGHGLSRVPSYAAQAKSGKIQVVAAPRAERVAAALIRIDAGYGFAYPALDLAIDELATMAPDCGLAAAAIYNSHHSGQATYHIERLAARGLVAVMFGNSPKAIAPWGGRDGVFGTNPIAMAAPRRAGPALVIDLSLSKVARGKIMAAAKAGETIPEGWALDREGRSIRDPEAALQGTMVPIGDAKGAALAMMVEILAATLVGANHGYEASSFFTAEGPPPAVGHLLLAIDGGLASGGSFSNRLEDLIAAVEGQEGVRLPGSRRLAARERAARDGLMVSKDLLAEIRSLVQGGSI